MTPHTPTPTGALDHGPAIRQLLNDAIAASGRTRVEIAERMTTLIGQSINKNRLDSWTAESRKAWRFPLEYLPAFLAAVESDSITRWLAEQRGGVFTAAHEAVFTKIGRLVCEGHAYQQELDRLVRDTVDAG